MPVPRLPPELTDRIIQAVERGTLPACALVCSSWLPASRYAMFRFVHIWSSVSYELLVSRVLSSESMKHHLPDVRKMVLWNRKEGDFPEDRIPESWPSFFQLFAAHLPNLTTLVLGTTNWDQRPTHPLTSLVLSRFISVRHLELRGCNFPSFGTLRRALSALPSLDFLIVEGGSWPVPSAELSPLLLGNGAYGSARPRLSTLHLYTHPGPLNRLRTHQLVTWLSTTATPTTLHKLQFMEYLPHEVGCRGLLDSFGPSFPLFMRNISALGFSLIASDEGD